MPEVRLMKSYLTRQKNGKINMKEEQCRGPRKPD